MTPIVNIMAHLLLLIIMFPIFLYTLKYKVISDKNRFDFSAGDKKITGKPPSNYTRRSSVEKSCQGDGHLIP